MSASETCPVYAPFFGFSGMTFAMVLSAIGAGYGTAKAGSAIAAVGTFRPQVIMTSLLPIVMSGVLTIYGLIVAVYISNGLPSDRPVPLHAAALQMGAGLAVGLACLASGVAIGLVGDAGVRGYARQPKLFLGMLMILIFCEVLSLYGLITGFALVIMSQENVAC